MLWVFKGTSKIATMNIVGVTQLRSYVTVNVIELELVITLNFNNNNTIIVERVYLKKNTYNIFQLLLFEIYLSIFWFIPNNN